MSHDNSDSFEDDDLPIDGDGDELPDDDPSTADIEIIKPSDNSKLQARHKLEELMEKKRLKEELGELDDDYEDIN